MLLRNGLRTTVAVWLLIGMIGCGGGNSQSGSSSNATGGTASTEGEKVEKVPAKATLLHASYDPTRELFKAVNAQFVPWYESKKGCKVTVNQSHGGSSAQARAVIDGLEADVVSLALWSDVDLLRQQKLVPADWDTKLANRSLPYTSTVVFLVRKGNPKGIKDWNDLVQSGTKVITPNPETSGGGKLNLLAAYGSVLLRGGDETAAKNFLRQLYGNVPVLDTGARAATLTFVEKKIGDVQITWENEGWLAVKEGKGEVELVYPSISIQAEPHVAVVEKYAAENGNLVVARDYLQYLYTPEAQRLIAENYYRPTDPAVAQEFAERFPKLELFTIDKLAKSWDDAQQKFFGENGVYSQIVKK